MHALVWHQSGGEPWSFSVPGERQPYVWRSAQQAVAEAHRSAPRGLSHPRRTDRPPSEFRRSHFGAVHAVHERLDRRATSHGIGRTDARVAPFTADPARCAIAAYGGSWDHPDNKFADAVLTSAAKGDAPDFDMPDRIDGPLDAAGSELSVSGQHDSAGRPAAADDQLQAWSSALFPAKAKQVDGTSSISPDADRLQESSVVSERPMTAPSQDDGLFVRRSPERRPQ